MMEEGTRRVQEGHTVSTWPVTFGAEVDGGRYKKGTRRAQGLHLARDVGAEVDGGRYKKGTRRAHSHHLGRDGWDGG